MSPAMRQDFISGLVRARHEKKEEGLAAQLVKWTQRALSQRLQLETRLAELGATPPAPGHAPANPRAELVAAHAAFKQGQGAGSSAVRTRLAWKHAYQEQLEE
ncbi:hypothetical protein HXX76_005346 [Chlamydomonas incerta]|uniref:Uncharacterized protein n=1 Tax=Chlamydomonas incerta TaxID=51695 RepID=A0A835VZ88_CHLIN|nr:hypothetical protein HXX76_008436 [Chlamydomonas incerta]KAG2438805.1 hypothetical protein HXX76_005346 [Chlamydomonas incerta]|eukprot:KAG2433375.1 hypothetical protein HXX76_008436 [Chlamydomonas incerta]